MLVLQYKKHSKGHYHYIYIYHVQDRMKSTLQLAIFERGVNINAVLK